MKPEIEEEEEEEKEPKVNKKTKKKIAKTVQEILETSNLYQLTEKKVREEAAAKLKLDLDLHKLPYKLIVRHEVESFLVKAQAQAQQKPAQDNDNDEEMVKKQLLKMQDAYKRRKTKDHTSP